MTVLDFHPELVLYAFVVGGVVATLASALNRK